MFDAPLDTWYVWLGLGAVSLAVAGTVLAFPTATAPDAAGVADAIDAVASSRYRVHDSVDVHADRMRLGSRRLALRAEGTTAHARFRFGPVTPVGNGPLRAVLAGTPPTEAFDEVETFRAAVTRAREGRHAWRPAPASITVRHVTWGEFDATLVG